MRVMVAMSGGVDSSVAAALALGAGHQVCGVTMKLWGGDSDTGCCSISDVDDARRVCQQLGIDHHVFNFGDTFGESVVAPYVEAHARAETPNPCIECNRHVKFARLLRRARALGFDALATGHHARLVATPRGLRVGRGADRRKDQSYVLGMLGQAQLAHLQFPIGEMTKERVRAMARDLGLRTAPKPDSQDVCFITRDGGRAGFLRERLSLHPGRVVDSDGAELGVVPAVELVTVGQRRGLGLEGEGEPRYVSSVDARTRTVTVGTRRDLMVDGEVVDSVTWAGEPIEGSTLAQCSAHGPVRNAWIEPDGPDRLRVRWERPQPRVAPGQTITFYREELVEGSGVVAA